MEQRSLTSMYTDLINSFEDVSARGLDGVSILYPDYFGGAYVKDDKVVIFLTKESDKDFVKNVKKGDIIVANKNFGCGSSREQAPGVLKALGVQAVVAKSFARIFYRNAINIGLPVIVCKDLPDDVKTGDTMELSMSDGTAHANGKTYSCTKLPEYMQNILNQGGLIASLNREED